MGPVLKKDVDYLTDADQAYISKAEAHINTLLKTVFRDVEEVYVHFEELAICTGAGQPSFRVQRALLKRYRDAGWTVEIKAEYPDRLWFS